MILSFKVAGRLGGSPPGSADAFWRRRVKLSNRKDNIAPLPCGDFEDAVKWRVLDQRVAKVRGKFAALAPDELELLIDGHGHARGKCQKGRLTRAPK